MKKMLSTIRSPIRTFHAAKRPILKLLSPFAGGSPISTRNGVFDLTVASDDDDDAQQQQQQRRKIMDFAQQARMRTSTQDQGNAAAVQIPTTTTAPAEQNIIANDNKDESAARNRIMSHAASVNAERGISSNSLLAQLHAERISRQGGSSGGGGAGPSSSLVAAAATTTKTTATEKTAPQSSGSTTTTMSILSYNVWFREDVAVVARMTAISTIISNLATLPDVICFQEMTPFILSLLSSAPWWKNYTVSDIDRGAPYYTVLLWRSNLASTTRRAYACLPFDNSIMGRDLKVVNVVRNGIPLRVATSHLESPTGWQNLNSAPRRAQCKQALTALDQWPGDSMLIGDLNWTDKNDGAPPFPGGGDWADAWSLLHGQFDPGYTYDAQRNAMLAKGKRRGLQSRLDRAFVKLKQWEVESIEMVGTEPLRGGERWEGRPVLPSDHYGLLVKLKGKVGS